MSTITTKDATQIYYKDWGSGRRTVLERMVPASQAPIRAASLVLLVQARRARGSSRARRRPSPAQCRLRAFA